MPRFIEKNNTEGWKRPRGKGKKIVLWAAGALILAAAAAVIANLSVLKLVHSPENIQMSGRENTLTILEQLEKTGSIRNLNVSSGGGSNAGAGKIAGGGSSVALTGGIDASAGADESAGGDGAALTDGIDVSAGADESLGAIEYAEELDDADDVLFYDSDQYESLDGIEYAEEWNDTNQISFSNADESITIAGEYEGDQVRRISGEIDAGRMNVTNIEEGKELARVMLSPYLGDAEITALLLRYAPTILSQVGRGTNINTSFDIGGNYYVTVTGSVNSRIEFNIRVK